MWRPCEDMPQIVALATSKSAAVLRRGSLAHPTVPVILVLAGEAGEWLRGLRAKSDRIALHGSRQSGPSTSGSSVPFRGCKAASFIFTIALAVTELG